MAMSDGEKKALIRMQHGHEANRRIDESGGQHDELAAMAVELETNNSLSVSEKDVIARKLQAANWPGYEWVSLADASMQTGEKKKELLKMAARGVIQAFVSLRPFKAKLQAFPWVENKREGGRECKGGWFPIGKHSAEAFVTFKDVNIDWFPATALDEDLGHPLQDHNYFLDQPQVVTRNQIYFRGSDVARWTNAGDEEQPASTERTEAQQRQVHKIELIRDLMRQEMNSGAWPRDKRGKDGLLSFVWRKHSVRIKREWGGMKQDDVRRKCSPCECRKLGIEPLPK